MKISQLIAELQKAQDEYGDLTIKIAVGDFYTVGGYDADIFDKGMTIRKYYGIGQLRIQSSINDKDGKKAKITFRK